MKGFFPWLAPLAICLVIAPLHKAVAYSLDITLATYAYTTNMDAAAAGEFGAGSTMVDWDDIKSGAYDLTGLDSLLGSSHAWVSSGGNDYYVLRHFYVIFDQYETNPSALQHDTFMVDGEQLNLQSWYGSRRILVAAVPIPAAAWLFGSALGLVGWSRKRSA